MEFLKTLNFKTRVIYAIMVVGAGVLIIMGYNWANSQSNKSAENKQQQTNGQEVASTQTNGENKASNANPSDLPATGPSATIAISFAALVAGTYGVVLYVRRFARETE